MAEHTPGPWLIAGATDVYAPGPDGANICSIGEPRASTTVQYKELELGSPDFDEACANAVLIAAAPDLLKALSDALPEIEYAWLMAKPGPKKSRALGKLQAARAAIAKAAS